MCPVPEAKHVTTIPKTESLATTFKTEDLVHKLSQIGLTVNEHLLYTLNQSMTPQGPIHGPVGVRVAQQAGVVLDELVCEGPALLAIVIAVDGLHEPRPLETLEATGVQAGIRGARSKVLHHRARDVSAKVQGLAARGQRTQIHQKVLEQDQQLVRRLRHSCPVLAIERLAHTAKSRLAPIRPATSSRATLAQRTTAQASGVLVVVSRQLRLGPLEHTVHPINAICIDTWLRDKASNGRNVGRPTQLVC
jgi:hypothetical protein